MTTQGRIYLGDKLVCSTPTDVENEALTLERMNLDQPPYVSGTAAYSARPVQQGQVCSFDGVDDHIVVAYSAELNPTGDFIASAWVKSNNVPVTEREGIVTTKVGSDPYGGWNICINSGKLSSLVGNGSTFAYVDADTAMAANTWYWVCLVYRGGVSYLYVDGVEQVDTSSLAINYISNTALTIGSFYTNLSQHFDGSICAVTLKNGSFTSSEVMSMYTLGGYIQNPSYLAPLNHAVGLVAYDSSGNANHGLLRGGANFTIDNTLPQEADRLNLRGFSEYLQRTVQSTHVRYEDVAETIHKVSFEMVVGEDITRSTTRASIVDFDTASSVWEIYIGSSTGLVAGEVLTLRGASSAQVVASTDVITAGRHLVELVYTTEWIFYVDGVAQSMTSNVSVGPMVSTEIDFGASNHGTDAALLAFRDLKLYDAQDQLIFHAGFRGVNDLQDKVRGRRPNLVTNVGTLLLGESSAKPYKDLVGNTLQYTRSVFPRRPNYRGSYGGKFDGVNDYVEIVSDVTGVFDSQNFTIKAIGTVPSKPGSSIVAGCSFTSAVAPFYCFDVQWRQRASGPDLLFGFNIGGTAVTMTGEHGLAAGAIYDIEMHFESGLQTIKVNGNIIQTMRRTGSITYYATPVWIGRNIFSSMYTNGTISEVEIVSHDGKESGHWIFSPGEGPIIPDIVGGRHSPVSGASTATEGIGFWAGRLDGEVYARNNNLGFSRAETLQNNGGTGWGTAGAVSAQSVDGDFVLETVMDAASERRLIGVTATPSDTAIRADLDFAIVFNTNSVRFWESGVKKAEYVGVIGDVVSIRRVGSTITYYVNDTLQLTSAVSSSGKLWVNAIFFNQNTETLGPSILNGEYVTWASTTLCTIQQSPRIPAQLVDSTLDAYGVTLTNPNIPIGNNGSETVFDAYNIGTGGNPCPASASNTGLTAIGFDAALTLEDSAYMRLRSTKENDRLIVFSDDLTGNDKTVAEIYTT